MRWSWSLLLVLLVNPVAARGAGPVEFIFRPPPVAGNPFARELWADVEEPDGQTRRLAAFYRGDDTWAVRARAAAPGVYRLGAVREGTRPDGPPLTVQVPGRDTVAVTAVVSLPQIQIDPRHPRHFSRADGGFHYPLGANFAWATGHPDVYYPRTFAAARAVGMNWARVWMAHWGRLNLDWSDPRQGPSPEPGWLDPHVAARWDRLLASAEENGIHVQLVLQHHGQYSSRVNSNWDVNPWNRANGGFLADPREFFTSAEARQYSRQKYRYIVARWGYSPAVFAWELFNEVKWTDARAGDAVDNAAVAAWHAEMAAVIRQADAYDHLVTTSDDALHHPLYAQMDFFQPHLYARNMLAAVRRFDIDPAQLDRPIFYGEMGDDNMDQVPRAFSADGRSNYPLAWASLMGESPYPGQLWYVQRLLDHQRLAPFGALTGFVRAAAIDQRPDLQAFSPAVESAEVVPYVLEPGAHWHRAAAPTVVVPYDGSVPAELGIIPRTLIWPDPAAPELDPFPSQMTLVLQPPVAAEAELVFRGAGMRGGSVRVLLDGEPVGGKTWPARSGDTTTPDDAVTFRFPVPAGKHTLVVSNPEGPDWVEFQQLDTGLTVPALAAVGRRAPDHIVLWVYHRLGIFAPGGANAARAEVLLSEVVEGRWRITWWDTTAGGPTQTHTVDHRGGTLRLPTPEIGTHTAAWLELL